MAKLNNQILIKLSSELNNLIDKSFSRHLRTTGEYITKTEFIRRIIEKECKELLGNK